MSLNISKKKIEEFDKILLEIDSNNLLIDINLFRKLFESDFFEHFLHYSKNKLEKISKNNNLFLHINIDLLGISDLYFYDKILSVAKLLHEFTDNILLIHIYGNSYIFNNLLSTISNSINFDISKKLIFNNIENFNSKFNKISIEL